MYNKATFQGRITKRPELNHTQNGVPVTQFIIAVHRDGMQKEGVKDTDFFRIVAWKQTAEYVTSGRFDKNDVVIVSGRMQTTDYIDATGTNREGIELILDDIYHAELKNSRRPATETDN